MYQLPNKRSGEAGPSREESSMDSTTASEADDELCIICGLGELDVANADDVQCNECKHWLHVEACCGQE